MALKVYTADNINTVIATVKSQGGSVSPNYISSVTSLPNILKRNLKEVSGVGESYAFSVAPLAIPASHSSGNTQNSRSLDYDIVVANTDSVARLPLLIMDTGVAAFQVTFKEFIVDIDELEENVEDTIIVFYINSHNISSRDYFNTLKDSLVYEGIDIMSTVPLTIPNDIGSFTCRALEALQLPTQSATYDINLDTLEFSIVVPRVLSEEEEEIFKRVSVFRSIGNDLIENNLRIAGAVTYIPALDTFYPNSNTTEDIPNLRDYLYQKQRQSYAGYLLELEKNQGLLLNSELKTSDTNTYTAGNMPDTFGKSSISVFDSVTNLFTGTAAIFVTTGYITNVSLGRVDETTEEGWISHLSIDTNDISTLQEQLELYGIFTRVSTTDGKVTKLALQRMLLDAGQTEKLSVRVSGTEPFTMQAEPNLTTLKFDDLPTATVYPSTRFTAYGEDDFFEDTSAYTMNVSLGVDQSTPMSDSLCTLFFKTHTAVLLRINTATDRVYSQYSTTSEVVEWVSQPTLHLSAYGYEDFLQTLATTFAEKTGYQVAVDVVKGCLHINSSQKTQKNLYVGYKYSNRNVAPIEYLEPTVLESQLKIESGHILRSETEVLVYMGDTFKSMPNTEHSCQYVVIDTAEVSEVTFIPFAYSVDGTLVREQTNYNITVGTADFYRNFLASDAIFFCNVFPIFENDVKTSKWVIALKDLVLDDKVLRNLLVMTDSEKTGIISQVGATTVGFTNTLQGVLQIVENDSAAFPSKYVSLNKKSGVSLNYATECQFTIADLEGTLTIELQDLDGIVETISTTYEIVEPPVEDPENTEPQPVIPTFTENLLTQLQESLYLDASESEGVVTLSLKNNTSSTVRLKVEDDAGALSMVSGAYELFGNTTRIILEKEVV